ncbi:hypothetical protein [Reyranella sp.]|uniref:hypothetical protein n=1 Tax=Reyranella sp. TaxID=1929291 RepID=UPI003C7A8F64
MMTYAMRPLFVLDLLFFLVLVPISVIGWSVVVLRRLWFRQWTAALASSAFLAFVALVIISPATFAGPMTRLVHKIEFLTMRSAYDAKVAATPNTGTPRFIKVSDLDTSVWCCSTQTFEEIWFDESDTLGSPDRALTDRFLWLSHPSYPGHSSYSIRSLGDHYYLVDTWY